MSNLVQFLQIQGWQSIETYEHVTRLFLPIYTSHTYIDVYMPPGEPRTDITVFFEDGTVLSRWDGSAFDTGQLARWVTRVISLTKASGADITDKECHDRLAHYSLELGRFEDDLEKMAYTRVRDTVMRHWPRVRVGAALAPDRGFHVSIRRKKGKPDSLLAIDYIISELSDYHVLHYILALIYACLREDISLCASSFMANIVNRCFDVFFSGSTSVSRYECADGDVIICGSEVRYLYYD